MTVVFSVIFYWIYLINISNFLDGADGYLTVNAIGFFLGLLSLTIFKGEFLFLKYVMLHFTYIEDYYIFSFPLYFKLPLDCLFNELVDKHYT
jgi:UDP-N-acetylmuramyl pentapeptide phosphotransferase/UDP-N-acetylglucosamine-1-phosphate transferase